MRDNEEGVEPPPRFSKPFALMGSHRVFPFVWLRFTSGGEGVEE
jgi:hypothetical protein